MARTPRSSDLTVRAVARWGEDEAERYLRRLGWTVVARNWHCRYGEIDLIARDGRETVFVEVKTRRGNSFGSPEEALTPTKRRRLLRSAWTYLEGSESTDVAWRFDVLAIEGRPGRRPDRLDHYRDAIALDEDAFR